MRFFLLLCLSCTGVIDTPSGPSGREPSEGDPVVATSGLRRLSPDELAASLESLLGPLDGDPVAALRPFESAPFDNDYTTQSASLQLVRALHEMAEDVANQVLSDPERRDTLVGCAPADAACARSFVSDFGRRAIGRSLSASEVDEYLELMSFAQQAVDDGVPTSFGDPFYEGVYAIVVAMLQDVERIYRVEAGEDRRGVRTLDGSEIARRLSLTLWGEMPDTTLLELADAGELDDASGRRAAAERMLDDPRAQRQLGRFHAMWLGYRQLTIPNETRELLRSETDALLGYVVFDDARSYLEVFRAEGSYLNRELAEHYNALIESEGMSASGALPVPDTDALEWVPYPAGSERRGILGQGSVLAAFGKFADTSPTQRGLLIRTRLLCQPIPRPPADLEVNTDNPPTASNPDLCKIDAYEEHRSNPDCASCHSRLDPVGFGLERFDNQGRWREHEVGRPECAIDGAGSVEGVGEFRGPAELSDRLIESGELLPCFVEQLAAHYLGRPLEPEDAGLLDTFDRMFTANAYDLRATWLDFVAHESFVQRRDEED